MFSLKGDNSAMLSKISKIHDDNKLLEIFKKSDDFEIRYAVVNLIGDDEVLYEIFSIDENPFIKSIALERISTDILDFDDFSGLDEYEKISYIEKCNDESLFYTLAHNDDDFYVRTAAIYRISDIGSLSKIADCHDDYDTRVVCYKKLNGQSLAEEITYENLTDSRINLVESIDSEKFIKDILINDSDFEVRVAALKRLMGTGFYFTVLRDVLTNDNLEQMYDKISFIKNTGDESALFELARNDNDFHVRAAAIHRISDWDFLSKMADTHSDYNTRLVLYKKLKGWSFHDEITKENLDQSHKSLVKHIDNENFLKDIAAYDSSLEVKIAALKKLGMPDFYLTILASTDDENELKRLIDNTSDESQLFDITCFGSSNQTIIENAINNIANPSLLFELYRRGPDLVRKTAMRKLVLGNVFSTERIADKIDIIFMILSIAGEDILTDIVKNDSDYHVRRQAVDHIKDPDILAHVAMNDSEGYVRKAAVERIEDADLLADIAMNDSNRNVRKSAVNHIRDADILADVAMNDSDPNVRKSAVNNIKDADLLAHVAMNDSDRDVRKAAVERIEDADVLADVAMNDSLVYVRRAAVERIGDEDILADIAMNNSIEEIRRIAAGKIGKNDSEEISDVDNNALADIAMNGSDYNARLQAVENITDEDVLLDIAINCNHDYVAEQAAFNITDEDVLIDLARGKCGIPVRYAAAQKINDKNVLAEIALSDPDYEVRYVAIKKIDDDDVLEEVLRNDSSTNARIEALKRIKDGDKLKNLLLENYGYFSVESFTEFVRNYDKTIYESMGTGIYETVLDRISDESVFEELVYGKLFGDFRLLVVQRLKSGDVLMDLALNDPDYRVRRQAIRNPNLSDEKTIVKILQKDRNDAVRLEALMQIDNPDIIEELADDLNPLIRTYALDRLGRTFEVNEDAVSFEDIDLASILKIEDENVLYSIVNHAPSSSIRRYAFDKITDANILTKLACNNREFANRALNKIDDNRLLLNIALYCNDPTAQRKAVKKIDDEELLLEAVQANPYNDISQYVVDHITDESCLEIIAFNNSNPFNRKAAVNKIQSQEVLIRLGEVECEEIVCTAIVRKCRDRELLEYMGLSNPCKTVRRYIGSLVDDDELLYKLTLKECEFDNRREMISRIGDEKSIVSLLKREYLDNVFKGDFNITDSNLLIDLARNSHAVVGRRYALGNIDDISVLRDFICSSPFSSREPEDDSLWKCIRYDRDDIPICLSILSWPDFKDMKMIEEFLIENDIYMCGELFDVRNKVDDIPSVYRIALHCKSANVRRLFKQKLEYPKRNRHEPDENREPIGLGALFG